MAFEQNKPIEIQDVKDKLDEKVSTSDVLTLEEIQASTDLTGKVTSASAVKQLDSKLHAYQFNLPDGMASWSAGTDYKLLSNAPYTFGDYILIDIIGYVYGQYRNLGTLFSQLAFVNDGSIRGVGLRQLVYQLATTELLLTLCL